MREADRLHLERGEARDRAAGLFEIVAEELVRSGEPSLPKLEDVAAEQETLPGVCPGVCTTCSPPSAGSTSP